MKPIGQVSRALCAAFSGLLVLSACDHREQKPKVALIASAHAQQADRVVPPTSITGAMNTVDEAFALFAASSNVAQIEASRLVLKTTRDDGVREYAQRVMRDHLASTVELRRIVAQRGARTTEAPTGRHADMVTKLSGVAGPQRDEAYLRRFGLDAHKEAIALFERHAAEGRDAGLRTYAQQGLAALREHMAAAHKLLHAAAPAR